MNYIAMYNNKDSFKEQSLFNNGQRDRDKNGM